MSPQIQHRTPRPRAAGATRPAVRALVLLAGLALLLSGAPGHAASPCGDRAVVARGDTLAAIARRCGTAVDDLLNANPQIGDPRRIQPGWVLRLPGATAAPPPPPSTFPPSPLPSAGAPASPPAGAARAPTPASRGPANRDGLTRDGYQPPGRGVQSLMIWPREGRTGSRLTLSGHGLAEGRAEIGIGPPGAIWQRLDTAAIGPDGGLETELPVPGWARTGEDLVVTLQLGNGGMLTSGRFRVTGDDDLGAEGTLPDGSLSVRGTLRQGDGCILLETPHGHLYGLTAGGWRLEPGTRVVLTALPAAGPPACDGARGTIEVVALHPDRVPETLVPPPPSAN